MAGSRGPTADFFSDDSLSSSFAGNLPAGSDNDDDMVDLTHDPAFVQRGTLFPSDDPSAEPDPSDSDTPFDPTLLPAAFAEHPIVREAYIRAFIASTFGGTTNITTQAMLESSRSTIASFLQRDPALGEIDLKSFAITIGTVERLGVDTDTYVKYYFVCDACWKRHEPETLYTLKSPNCTQDGCLGKLYTIKRTRKLAQKRLPGKILPYVKLLLAIQHILLHRVWIQDHHLITIGFGIIYLHWFVFLAFASLVLWG
ncbi:hypothetical protein JB92DRAFT_1498464 [Gautieria morchelliformis]|nr:hypothetical protein JB92DRAFT_1498464 [Gautieria morchelliformis]